MPEADGVNVTWQLAESLVGFDRAQVLELNVPAEPDDVNVTVPVGAVGLASVSVTVTEQAEPSFTTTVADEQVTLVAVVWRFGAVTVKSNVSELVEWVGSPL